MTDQIDSTDAVTFTGQPAPDAPPQSWDEIFKHPRFKELQKAAKEAQTALEAQRQAQVAAEEAKLREEKRWQDLYEAKDREAAQLKDELTAKQTAIVLREKQLAIQDAARAHEPPFIPEAIPDVLRLIAADELPEGDELAQAAAAKIKELAKNKPWLLQATRQDPGSPPGRKPSGPQRPTSTGRPMGI